MERINGTALRQQLAYGYLRFYRRPKLELTEYSSRTPEEEWVRFQNVQRRAVLQLAAYYDRAARQVGREMAEVFAIHAMLLEDEDLVETTRSRVWDEGNTAEFAVQTVGQRFGAAFSAMDDPYMRARSGDIRDIARRVIRMLIEQKWEDPLVDGPAILVANTLLPSEVMELDCKRLLGIVARRGTVDSHAALLLHAYGIPAMVDVELDEEWDGHLALMDGFDQCLYVDPEQDLLEELRARYQAGAARPGEQGGIKRENQLLSGDTP